MLKTIALRQGWNPECLGACLQSNMGFLEHEETRLSLSTQSLHSVTPNVPILIAANSSARKSSLITYTNKLLHHENSPCEGLRTGKGVIMQDATMKGIRQAIVNNNRASVSTDELVNTYQTPWSEQASGINYLGRSKMNTFLSCENDDSVTAVAQTHLNGYAFQHKVAGQIAPALWLLRPASHGYQKRLTLVISEDKPREHPEQEQTESESLMKEIHDWMQEGPMRRSEIASLDGYAKKMYDNVHFATQNFIAEPPAPVPDPLKTKLNFSDTDLLRLWHINLRFLQILLSRRWPKDALELQPPKFIGVLAFALAIRGWLRQIHIHSAYYKSVSHLQQTIASNPSRGPAGDENQLAAAMAGGAAVLGDSSKLEGIERLMHQVVRKCKGNRLNSSTVHNSIRNMRYTLNSGRRVHRIAMEVLDRLVQGGFATEVGLKRSADGKPSKGRRVRIYKWKTWPEISQDPTSNAIRLRLGLTEDDFSTLEV